MGNSKLDLTELGLKRIYKFCKLLNIDSIKAEFDEYIKGYSLNNIERKNGSWVCSLTSADNKRITLIVEHSRISIFKRSANAFERISIDGTLLLSHKTVEKRPNGLVYSKVVKQFFPSSQFRNKIVLVDLVEHRYAFTKENLERLLNGFNFEKVKLDLLFVKLINIEFNVNLGRVSDFHSDFSTHMNCCAVRTNKEKNVYPTRTRLNGEDISSVYEVNDGSDKLYRVYDLYRGIINPRNENDINLINLGLLSQEAYDLKGLKGITEREDSIVGKPLDNVSDEYISYLQQLFNNKYGYRDNLQLDRNSILAGITCQISGMRHVKRAVESKLGIPYDEFAKLDIAEQQKLIEQKTGKKINLDYRLHIDSIPIDEDHIITRQKIDSQIDDITNSGPRRILQRIFKRNKY